MYYWSTVQLLFIGARHPGRPDPLIYHSGDAGGPMMAIFPRKYQHPRYSRTSGCPPLPPPALVLLQACCRGYAAGAMPQGLCCLCSNCCTGHIDRHAPTAALATQIGMLQLLHWPHRSACSNCTGHKDQPARHALLLHSLKAVGAQRGSVLNLSQFKKP